MLKVREYMKNVGKSITYAASDVMSEHYETLNDFKNTNREVFKEAYTAVKDYRATFARVKTQIVKSDIYTAANLGINNIISDIKTGKFYNKERENEYASTYGGSLMDESEWDMDSSDFDWDNKSDVSEGEKIIATAIKKNNKMSTVMMADAMTQGHKAIIDSSRENTTLLYVQQEKLYNKVGGSLDNITSILKNNAENNAKVQNQHMKNTATFFTNMEKKTDKIVAQLDEMIQMQRNLYKREAEKEKERKKNTVTDISPGGIPNLKEYKNAIKKNIQDTISEITGGAGSMGDALGGANFFAMMTSNPLGEVMKWGMNKALGKEFKKASKDFDNSLKGYFSTLMAKANNAKFNSEDGVAKFLGSIFGLKIDKEASALDTSKYNRGPIPFDGITKKSITEVIPYYLRKMTAILTGDDEEVFDYKTGKWRTVRSVQKQHDEWKNAGAKNAIAGLNSLITDALGKNTNQLMTKFRDQKKFKENYDKLAEALYRTNGDLNILNRPYDYGIDAEFLDAIKTILQDTQYYYDTTADRAKKDENGNPIGTFRSGSKTNSRGTYRPDKIVGINRSKGANGIRTGINSRSVIANLARNIIETKSQRADQMRSMEKDADLIERLLYSEGIVIDPDSKNNPSIRTKHGDYNVERAFNSPLAQAMKFVQDEHGNTLFKYLQYIKRDLTALRVSGLGLLGITGNKSIITDNEMNFEKGESKRDSIQVESYIKHGGDNFYKNQKNEAKEEEAYDKKYENALEKWKNEKKGIKPREIKEFKDIIGFLNDREEELQKDAKKELKDKKDIYDIMVDWNFLKKEEADKFKEILYDKDKTMKQNLSERKGMEKVALLTNYATKLVQKPWEAATDAVVSLDKWISDLFFGKALRKTKEDEEDEQKGLLASMKDHIKDGFTNIIDSLSDKVGEWMEKFNDKIKDKLSPAWKWLFGEKADSESPREGGILNGGFVGKIGEWFRKNTEDIKQWALEEARKAKEAVTGKKDEDEDSSTSSSSITNSIIEEALTTKNKKQLINLLVVESKIFKNTREFDKYYKYCKDNNFSYRDAIDVDNINIYLLKNKSKKVIDSSVGNNIVSGSNSLTENKFGRKMKDVNFEDIDSVKDFLRKSYFSGNTKDIDEYIEWAEKNIGLDDLYRICLENNINEFKRIKAKNSSINKTHQYIEKVNNKFSQNPHLKSLQEEYQNAEGSTAAERFAKAKNKLKESEEEATQENTNVLKRITSPIEKIANYLEAIANKLGAIPIINNPTNQQARGGINKTGRAFPSVVSSGEIINGNVVPPGGPYITTIPKDGVVINPADENTINRQAREEKSFFNKLRFNAKANDNLSEATIIDKMKDEKNQEFAADVIAKGGIGFAAGLLLGHPLLAAGVGIASGFSKKTNSFANAIFGTASGVDENGNPVRQDDGLLSKEVQKAIPDIKRFGLGGAIAGLITPFGPVGGLLIGSALGFAKNNGLVKDTLFGPDGVFEKDKADKLRKALPNIGIGAAAGALLGPFGLVGNAILGATAGYVTSMDKFKTAIFGKDVKRIDKDGNEITVKEGGLVGAIKKGAEPLKNFGRTVVEGLTDAIFGKKIDTGKTDENGDPIMKRKGGIFGMVKDQIISPIAEGLKPILQETKIMFKKTIGVIPGMVKKYIIDKPGTHLGDRISGVGSKIAKAGINLGKGALWLGATPLMLGAQGIKGIGAGLRRKQIRRGQADDMTAEERLAYRKSSNFMQDIDDYYNIDQSLARLGTTSTVDELEYLRSVLLYATDEGSALDEEDRYVREEFDKELTRYISGRDANRIMKQLNRKGVNYNKAERILRGNLKGIDGEKLAPEQKQKLIDELHNLYEKRDSIIERHKEIKKRGKNIDSELKKLGLSGVKVNDKKQVNKLVSYLNTEISHKEAGVDNSAIGRNTTELEENTSEIKKLTEAITDQIRAYIGFKDDLAKKYGFKGEIENQTKRDSQFRKDSDEEENDKSDNNSNNKDELEKIMKTMKGPFKKTRAKAKLKKDLKKKMEEAAYEKCKELENAAAKNWEVASKEAFNRDPDDPDNPNVRQITLDGITYKVYSKDKEETEKEYKYYVRNYIDSRIPKSSPIRNFIFSKAGRLMYKIHSAGVIKTTMALAFAAATPASGLLLAGYGASRLVKLMHKHDIRPIRSIATGIGHGALAIGRFTKNKLYRDSTGKDLSKKARKEWRKLSDEEKMEYAHNKWEEMSANEKSNYNDENDYLTNGGAEKDYIKEKIDELEKQGGNKSGLLARPLKTASRIKAGVKNYVAGVINNAKKKGKDASPLEKLIFNISDKLGNIKEGLFGKKGDRGGLLQKIFGITKWVVGAPLLVGFLSKFKSKIGPMIIGKKDSKGNYSGGMFSGVANAFKESFNKFGGKIRDWFKNEGDYKNTNTGLQGFYKNFKSLLSSLGDTWKLGFDTILHKWVPYAVEHLITGLPAAIGGVIKGAFNGILGLLKLNAKANDNLQTITFNDTMGGSFSTESLTAGQTYSDTDYGDESYLNNVNNEATYSSGSSGLSFGSPKAEGSSMLTRFAKNKIATRFGSKLYRSGGKLGGKVLEKSGKLVSKLPGGVVTKGVGATAKGIGKVLQFDTAVEKSAESVVEKLSKEGAENAAKKGTESLLKGGTEQIFKETAENVVEKGSSGVIKKICKFLSGALEKIFKCGPFKKAMKKAAKEGAEQATEKGLKKAIKELTEKVAKGLAKKASSALAKITTKIGAGIASGGLITAGFVLYDFTTGMADARNILQIVDEKISWVDRILAGLSKVLSGIIILFDEQICCGLILNIFGQLFFPKKVAEIQQKQEQAKLIVQQYNEENGTNYSINDYNNEFNGNAYTKVKEGISKVGKGIWNGIKTVGKTIMGTNARANSHLQPIDLDSNSQSEPYISGKTNKKNKTIKTLATVAGGVLGGPIGAVLGNALSSKAIEKSERAKERSEFIKNLPSMFIQLCRNISMIANKVNGNITNTGVAGKDIKSDTSIEGFMSNSINTSVDAVSQGIESIAEFKTKFDKENQEVNQLINSGKLGPIDKGFWNINLIESGNPLIDSMLKMNEYMSRLIRAPFSMVAQTMGNVGAVLAADDNNNNSNNNSESEEKDTSPKKGKSLISKIGGFFKGLFGKGKDDNSGKGSSDHIYQRDYSGSFQTAGDTERQTIADSGCGPAAAATVMNRYGLHGDLNKAAKFATTRGYKEVNGGTYPEYFNDYLSQKGIQTKPTQSNAEVVRSLAQGKPVIMMGRNSNNNSNTPYGSKYSHYVVATGLDKNGQVIVEDSEDRRGQTRYSLADTLKNTSIKITTSANGKYGRGSSFASVFSNYTESMIKGMYGGYYNALFGLDTDDGQNGTTSSGSNNSQNQGSSNITNVQDSSDVETRKKIIWDFLISHGCSKNFAAAIMGNMRRESGFDPTAGEIASGASGAKSILQMDHPLLNDHPATGHGWGLCQWSYGEGHAALYNWCEAHGLSADTLEGQLNYLIAGLKGIDMDAATNPNNSNIFNCTGEGVITYTNYLVEQYGGFDYINGLSIPDAVIAFYKTYERGYNEDSDIAKSIPWAQEIYDQFANSSGSGKGKKINASEFFSNKVGKGKYGRGTKNISKSRYPKLGRSKPKFGRASYGPDQYLELYGSPLTYNGEKVYITGEVNEYGGQIIKTVNSDQIVDADTAEGQKIYDTLATDLNCTSHVPSSSEESSEDNNTDESQNETTPAINSSNSFLTMFGEYTGSLMKGLYGNYWTALFGNEEANGEEKINPQNVHAKKINNTAKVCAPIAGRFKINQQYSINGLDKDGNPTAYGGPHFGVDMKPCDENGNAPENPIGTKIFSLCNGQVIQASYGGNAGNVVSVCSSDSATKGKLFTYMHLDEINVKKDQQVTVGQLLGTLGNTGECYPEGVDGAHLHFEIDLGGVWGSNSGSNPTQDPAEIMGIPSGIDVHNVGLDAVFENELFPDTSEDYGVGKYGRGKEESNTSISKKYSNNYNKKMSTLSGSSRSSYGRGSSNNHNKSNRSLVNTQIVNKKMAQAEKNRNLNIYNENRLRSINDNGSTPKWTTQENPNYMKELQNLNQETGYGYGIEPNISSTKINQLNLSNDQLISILEVIADNSNKTDQIIQLLAAIVTNTSSTNNTQSNSTNKINQLISQLRSNNSSSAPIAGLNNILNNNSENTAKAVYSIAKS